MLKLTDDDGQAVDMLLDPSPAPDDGPIAAPAHFRERLARVEAVLSLLDEMPATDPPTALLHRIIQSIATHSTPAPALIPTADRPPSTGAQPQV